MSYIKDYLIWAGEKLENDNFGTWEEIMDYLTTTPIELLPRWISMEAYINEVRKR